MRRSFFLPALLLFLVLSVLPLLLGLGYALAYSLGLTGLLNEGFTLEHWRKLFGEGELWTGLWLSFRVAFVSTALAAGLAMAFLSVFRKELERGMLSRIIYLPLTLPAVGVAFLVFQLFSASGLLSRLSTQAGFTDSPADFPSLTNDGWGIGIIIAHAFMATPFFTLLFFQIFRNEKLAAYADLAASLGAGRRQILWRSTLPMLWWKALPVILLYFIFVLSAYETPLLLGRQDPQMISVLAIRKLQKFNLADIPQAYAISVFYALLVFGFLAFWTARLRKRGPI